MKQRMKAGRKLLGKSLRIQVAARVDPSTLAILARHRSRTGLSLGQVLDAAAAALEAVNDDRA